MNQAIDSQEPVFSFLAGSATGGGHKVKRVDTHAAVLFLGDERVLKVKRAVRFAFLDFSTLDKRKAACAAEIEVNRAYAPDIYRRVVPITRDAAGELALDGEGTPVEWAVEMRRFDETQALRSPGRCRTHRYRARRRARPHRRGGACACGGGRAGALDRGAVGLYRRARGGVRPLPDLFPPSEVEKLARAGRAAYRRIHPLLVERGRQGLVRRIHGDLHLGNIVLIDGRPVLFDAIEFSAADRIGRRALRPRLPADGPGRARPQAPANVVFNRYLASTQRVEDLDALAGAAVLPLDARSDPRQGDRRAARTGGSEKHAGDRARGTQIFRLGLPADRTGGAAAGRGRRASPAPASRCSRARWRRN